MRAPAGLSPIARGAFHAAADAVQASGHLVLIGAVVALVAAVLTLYTGAPTAV